MGRAIRGRSRADEHREVLEEIVETAAREEVDLVLVAGDLFDTAAPSPEAERIVYQALLGLAEAGAEVVVVAGNHDNPHRLRAVKPVLERGGGVHVGAYVTPPAEGGVLQLETRRGERVQIALFPFLSQRGIVRAADLMEGEAAEHAGAYADAAGRILRALFAAFEPETVRVLVGHLMVANALPGGGERAIHLSSEYAVPAFLLDPANHHLEVALHYAALGHVHHAQPVAAGVPAWYCGSPLMLDFGDTDDTKRILLVEATPGTPAEVRPVPLRGGRRLVTLRGGLSDLPERAEEASGAYLRVLLDEAPRPGLAEEVRELLPDAVDVRLVRESADEGQAPADELLLERSPAELFAEFLRDRGRDDDALRTLFAELLEEVHATEAVGG